jgi:MFS family permease
MAGSAAALGLSLLWLSQTSNWWMFLLAFGVVGSFGITGLNHPVINPVIAKWFVRRRGLATGITYSGINVGTIVLAPLIVSLLHHYGWRTTWMLLAGLPWLVVIPPALLWFHRQPEDLGLRPDGVPNRASEAASDESNWTPRAAVRTSAFWLLGISGFLDILAYTGDIIHRLSYMMDLGFSSGVAAATLMTYNFTALFAKLVWGPLADRLPLKQMAVALTLGSAAGLLLLIDATSVWSLFAYSVSYSIAVSGVFVVEPLLWAAYFGPKFQGAIRGLISPLFLLAAGCGPMFAAWIYDAVGSYSQAFFMLSAVFVLAATCRAFLRRPIRYATT